ncbi:MAG: hypothetical protein H0W89_02150 [Candidatus Levybacteria bacterium]|nr:hypothetical protein [Candidatus Levybacteria bacterium]
MKKLTIGIATGALLAAGSVTQTFAQTAVDANGNGAFSSSDVNVSNECSTDIAQRNNTDIENDIRNLAYTGGNNASFNTGGSVTIITGDASSNTEIANAAGVNQLSGVNGCSNGTAGVGIGSNGAFSDANVDISSMDRETYKQYSENRFMNSVYNNLTTGNNYAGFNTGSDVVIITGSANADVALNNQAGSNLLR